MAWADMAETTTNELEIALAGGTQASADSLDRPRPFGVARAVGEEDDGLCGHGRMRVVRGRLAATALTSCSTRSGASSFMHLKCPSGHSRA